MEAPCHSCTYSQMLKLLESAPIPDDDFQEEFNNEYEKKEIIRLPKSSIKKHIAPTCRSDIDAIDKTKAGRKDRVRLNHVFKVKPTDFRVFVDVYRSKKKVRYWKVKRGDGGSRNYAVIEKGYMYAYFDYFHGHFLHERSEITKDKVETVKRVRMMRL